MLNPTEEGLRFKACRLATGMSQEDFAAFLGEKTSMYDVRQIEEGKQFPNIDHVSKLTQIGFNGSYLLHEAEAQLQEGITLEKVRELCRK
jgi:transcriptional regulator with XRE-family HTH domain